MTEIPDRLEQQRLQKLERMRARGVNPYPNSFHTSHTTAQAVALLTEAEAASQPMPSVIVAGRVMSRRDLGKIAFMDIRDSSGKVQLFCHKDHLDSASLDLLKDIDLGDIVGARGMMMRTRSGEPTVDAVELTMLAKSLQPLPEKWHGLQDVEKRYRQRYLDLIANPVARDIFITRSRVLAGIRRFMDEHGFLEVETPVLQPEAGGAMARPFVTHHQALDCDLYLRIALELHLKRLIIGGFDRVYEIGRIFRNEGISTRHNPEFTMMESYQAYADYRDVMFFVEELVFGLVKQVTGGTVVTYSGTPIDFTPPWPRLTMRDAVLEHAGFDFLQFMDRPSMAAEMAARGMSVDPAKDWGRLLDEVVSRYVEPHLVQPTFLVDHPVAMSPLAKRKPEDPRLVERFEAFCGNMELANAFTELNDPIEQRRRFQEQMASRQEHLGEEQETIDEDFLVAMEHGMPPTGGLGVGIDRLVMLLTGQESIREVILFPTLKERE